MHAGTQHPLQLFGKQGITVKVLSEWLSWLFGMYQSYFRYSDYSLFTGLQIDRPPSGTDFANMPRRIFVFTRNGALVRFQANLHFFPRWRPIHRPFPIHLAQDVFFGRFRHNSLQRSPVENLPHTFPVFCRL